jgi:hypothetical protein
MFHKESTTWSIEQVCEQLVRNLSAKIVDAFPRPPEQIFDQSKWSGPRAACIATIFQHYPTGMTDKHSLWKGMETIKAAQFVHVVLL